MYLFSCARLNILKVCDLEVEREELRDELAREYSKNRYMFNVYEVLARGLRRRPGGLHGRPARQEEIILIIVHQIIKIS